MTPVIFEGDCPDIMRLMADESVNTCVTSPPYFDLRDYGVDGQIGLEQTPDEYVARLVEVFREVRRVLRDDGTLWLNLGDSYARSGGAQGGGNRELMHLEGKQMRMGSIPDGSGLKPKDLIGIPWRVAFALQSDGWCLRQDIIWAKPNPMPESVKDRCTKSHEYIFMFSKRPKYYFDHEAIKEPVARGTAERYKYGFGKAKKKAAIVETGHWHTGKDGRDNLCGDMNFNNKRNKRDVWTVATKPFKEAHFATFPPDLIEPCILAGCPEGGTVFDPFFGAGTTGLVAMKHGRKCIGIELNKEYAEIARRRLVCVT